MAAGESDKTLAEFRLIERYFHRDTSAAANILTGIGDDAAITRVPSGCDLVTATDTLVEGTHFLPSAPARSIGHRVLAVNLSDLAAMGAAPLWASLALSIPAIDEVWLEDFSEGFFRLAERFQVHLIGGDTVKGPCAATVTVQGVVQHGAAVLRSGARPGDRVFVSGAPGAATAGRLLLESNPAHALCDKFLYPEPQVELGKLLAGLVSSMIDVSDGLCADLGHLLTSSRVGAELTVDELDLSLMTEAGFSAAEGLDLAIGGGEDYELVFTAPVSAVHDIEQLTAEQGIPLTALGEIVADATVRWQNKGSAMDLPAGGFRHFQG